MNQDDSPHSSTRPSAPLTPRRRALAARTAAIVKAIARNVARSFGGVLDEGELESRGYVGLVTAARRYDPDRGPFEPYARARVLGSMVSGVRRESILRRRQRRLAASRR